MDLLTMVINHLLTGMILQAKGGLTVTWMSREVRINGLFHLLRIRGYIRMK